jgi:putative membrane protein
MTNSANYFTDEEKARIEAAVRAAEVHTSGEIVPLVIDAAYSYPRAEIHGGGLLALALAANGSWWLFDGSLWICLAILLLGYWPCRLLLRLCPPLLRRLIHPAEIDAEVAECAKVAFLDHNLHRTVDGTGILILICLFEHRVQVLADRGIHHAVPAETWQRVADMVTTGIRTGRTADALCEAIACCGDLLAEKFPPRAGDTDELPNLITS